LILVLLAMAPKSRMFFSLVRMPLNGGSVSVAVEFQRQRLRRA